VAAGCGRPEQPAHHKPWLERASCAVAAEEELEVLRLLETEPDRVHRKLSACFQRALSAGRLAEAARHLVRLDSFFDGTVRVGEHRLPRAAAFAALLDAHLRQARQESEQGRDAEAAATLIQAHAHALTDEDERRVEGTQAWIGLREVEDLGTQVASHDGPRVVLLVDDFQLGEALLGDVAARWAQEGRKSGLRVGVLPILRGRVRAGMRRVRASATEERASLAARAVAAGLDVEKGGLTSDAALEAFGLDAEEGAILVFTRDGRIVGRRIERILDPRPLSAVVERVTSR
jgi:hypothetical protein